VTLHALFEPLTSQYHTLINLFIWWQKRCTVENFHEMISDGAELIKDLTSGGKDVAKNQKN